MSRLVHQLSTPTLALLCAALLGCPPIQTGLVRARVVLRTGEALVPVPGARCSLDAGAQALETDAEGVLRFAGAPPGLHTVGCVATGEGGVPYGVFREVDLPEQRGHGGFVDLGDIELAPIGAPGPVHATAQVRAALVSWSPPESSGGAPITAYRIRGVPGTSSVEAPGTATEASVSGLADGTEYTFEVAAVTLHGPGPGSVSNPIRTPRTPSPPLAVRATPSVASAVVSWWAPLELGGAELSGFTVTATPGDLSLTAGPGLRSLYVTGLSPATVYRFTVVAHNAVGSSAASVETLPLTPHSPPEVIELLTAEVVGGCVQVDYRLAQAELQSMDVVVEFAAPGSDVFRRATQGGSDTGEGVLARAPGSHRFLWNSGRDLPKVNGEIQLRLSARLAGAAGTAQVRRLTVANGLSDWPADCEDGFTLRPVAPLPAEARRVEVGDLDGDGRLDAVALTVEAVLALRGRGDGSFAPFSTVLGGPLGELALADLDRDGALDIVGNRTDSATLELLYGNGDGTFQPPVSQAAGLSPAAVAAGDLDGDGVLDLVVVGGPVGQVLRGLASGGFSAAATFDTGVPTESLRALALADLDGDGALEVLAGGQALYVFTGEGLGVPGGAQVIPLDAAVSGRLVVGDLDGDGIPDVVAGSTVILGTAAGMFRRGGPSPVPLAAGDVDGDGYLDLLSASAVHLGKGDGTFPLSVELGATSVAIALGALDGDGHADAVLAVGSQLEVVRGAGR